MISRAKFNKYVIIEVGITLKCCDVFTMILIKMIQIYRNFHQNKNK